MKRLAPSSLLYWFFLVSSPLSACNKELHDTISPVTQAISFENTPQEFSMVKMIQEASGIADSRINPGYLWVEEDSGNPPQLYLLKHDGTLLKTVYIKGVTNRDWEDISLAAGPDAAKKYIYIAEIGDNDAVHASSYFYRFEEPAASTDTVRSFDSINFSYADGPRDAEAFLVDDASKDIYIISKRDASSRLYKLAWPYATSGLNNAVFVQDLPYNSVVSAAISNDGKNIIVKTYTDLYYYPKTASETIPQVLQKTAVKLGYRIEPQGEAVGFALDNSGFYTLSEKGFASTQSLFFYKKK